MGKCARDYSEGAKTKQSFRDECDINKLMGRYAKQGGLPPVGQNFSFGDVSSVPDYQECLNKINSVADQFAALPLKVRKRFNYSALALLQFLDDPSKVDVS